MKRKTEVTPLVTEVHKVLMSKLSTMPSTWEMLSAKQQNTIDIEVKKLARDVVVAVAAEIVGKRNPCAEVRLHKFKVDDGELEGSVTMTATDENVVDWMHSMGRTRMLVFVNPVEFGEIEIAHEIGREVDDAQLDIEDAIKANGVAGEKEGAEPAAANDGPAPSSSATPRPTNISDVDPAQRHLYDFDPETGEIIPEAPRPPRTPAKARAGRERVIQTKRAKEVPGMMSERELRKMGNDDENWGSEKSDELDGDGAE